MEKEFYTKEEVSKLLAAKDAEREDAVKKAVAEALEAKEREERCALLLQERAYFRTLTGPCRHNMLYFNDVRT